ncbi:MAG: PAS domain-containing protein [Deltaproteobacteria bacterium]|nr:PAS domain-containing protein [Deltaproteobacteria bacterium]
MLLKRAMNRKDKRHEEVPRGRADEMALGKAPLLPENLKALSPEETRRMIHEMRVHQIELETQTEELRRAQAELDAARACYYDLYDLAPVGYCTISEKGLILEANLTAAILLGIARRALTQQPISRFILKEDQHVYYLHRKQLFETGEPQVYELRMVKNDGTPLWAHLATTAALDADGAPVSRVVMSDITEHKQAEEALRKSERYALTLTAVNDGLWDWHIPSGNAFFSALYYAILGYEDGEFPATYDSWRLRVHPEDIDNIAYEVQNSIKSGGGLNTDLRMRKKTGEWLWVCIRGMTIERDADGKALRMVGMMSDITERKRAGTYGEMYREVLQILNEMGDLRDSIQRVLAALMIRTGFDAVGIRLQDGDDFPYFGQKGFSSDFLLTENTLIARPADDGVCRHKDGNAGLECICGLVISGKTDPANPLFTPGGSFWTNDSSQLLNIAPDEDPRLRPRNQCIHQGYASMALVPIRNKDRNIGLIQLNDRSKGCFTLDSVVLLEGIASHIGAALMRKRAEEALRKSEMAQRTSLAEKEVLLKEVHHRVKNNLAAIMGLLDLQGQTMDHEPARATLTELSAKIRSMALVHEQLYQSDDFSRIDFQDYLEALIGHLRSYYKRSADIHFSMAATGVVMGLDIAVPCGLLITELVTNALKYAFPADRPCPGAGGCEITVSATWDGATYTLIVADNGVGLPANLDWTNTKTLGLLLVKMLGQHQLQGRIELNRTSGTMFRLRFAPREMHGFRENTDGSRQVPQGRI